VARGTRDLMGLLCQKNESISPFAVALLQAH
jgi:hypothetical protein